jgi:small subunit ribosomal protein S16
LNARYEAKTQYSRVFESIGLKCALTGNVFPIQISDPAKSTFSQFLLGYFCSRAQTSSERADNLGSSRDRSLSSAETSLSQYLSFTRGSDVAVRIRLKKMGRTHRPFFRVCAMDGRSPRDGRVIEQLGTYDPMVPHVDARAILNGERIAYWMSVGATPTPKVGTLIKKYGKDGSHLEAQAEAISQLSERRQKAIESAKAAAASVEMPKVEEPKSAEEPAAEGAAAEGAEAAAEETKSEEPKAEASSQTEDCSP